MTYGFSKMEGVGDLDESNSVEIRGWILMGLGLKMADV